MARQETNQFSAKPSSVIGSSWRWRWASGIAAFLLVVFVCYLLGVTYRTQQRLQKTAMIRLQENLEGLAQAVDYFILERRNDLQKLASGNTAVAYFTNKALGMSMEYGLKESLNNIVRQFQHLNESTLIKTRANYSRLALFSAEGEILAEYAIVSPYPVQKLDWQTISETSANAVSVSVDRANPAFLLFTAPVLVEERIIGFVAGWVPFDVIHDHFLEIRRSPGGQISSSIDTIILVAGKDGHVAGDTRKTIPDSDIQRMLVENNRASSLSGNPNEPWFFEWVDTGGGKILIAVMARLAGMDIRLFHILEYQQIVDPHGPLTLLITLALVSVGVIGIFLLTVHYGARAQVLVARLSESDRKQAEIREANETLELRVRERSQELEKIHAQMVIQEKMASVGQLAAGVAHELNNPLHFVSLNFVTLAEYFEDIVEMFQVYRKLAATIQNMNPSLPESETVRTKEASLRVDFIMGDIPDLFEESSRGLDRISRIIQSLLGFSHVDHTGEFTFFNINSGIEDTLVLAKNEYKYIADVTTDMGELSEIRCMSEKLNQVFLNLIVNGAQAIGTQNRSDRGRITIRTWQDETDVYCEITDDGPGIPANIQNRIFEPFFTTKPPGRGTGLGLSICYDIIVEKHKGTLIVNCPESGGTVFSIRIPKNL
ncbi:MAG: ATP-binding protein [Deltaproteobacteria bacterium]